LPKGLWNVEHGSFQCGLICCKSSLLASPNWGGLYWLPLNAGNGGTDSNTVGRMACVAGTN